MSRIVALRVTAMPLLAVLAGCGYRPPEPAPLTAPPRPLFSRAKTSACLVAHGGRLTGRLDFVASSATGGAFVVHLGAGEVTVSFGTTAADGRRLETAYLRFAPPEAKADLRTRLRVYDNVVAVWAAQPSPEALDLLVRCLQGTTK